MIEWFRRQRLVKKGMACDKQRRKFNEDSWRAHLEGSMTLRVVLCVVYALIIFGLALWRHDLLSASQMVLISIALGTSLLFLSLDLPEIWGRNSRLGLLLGAIAVNLLSSKVAYLWCMSQAAAPHITTLFLIPVAFAPLLASVLFGTRAGLFCAVFCSLLDSFAITTDFALLFVNLATGCVAVYFTQAVRQRGHLLRAGFAIGITSFVAACAFGIAQGRELEGLLQHALISVGIGIGTAMVINSLLPVLESLFGINTNITWVELTDLNHPILRQLSMEAPGTYHHSLAVANLAEAAANRIGVNPTFCRVLSYFHDIGKLSKPEYFIENATGENLHENLTPQMSALIIAAHVKDGVDLGLKHRVKKPILDGIQQHHGDSFIIYFYRRALQLAEDAKAGSAIFNAAEDMVPTVSEQNFRYPGPKPQSKEVGILMLADSIESASRSLDRPTPARIEELVNDIIQQKLAERQLDECPLTLQELRHVAESFTFTLKTMLHSRISYPKHATAAQPSLSQQTKRTPVIREESRPPLATS